VSFEVGISRLGGHATFLQQETIGLTTRESVHDIAQVLSLYTASSWRARCVTRPVSSSRRALRSR